MRWQLQGVCYIVSKRHALWSTNGFKLEVIFYQPSIKSAFHFIARLLRRRSANGTQPHFGKRWTVRRANICRRKFVVDSPKKYWGQKLLHLFGFSTTSRFNGEYLLNETWHRQSMQGRWKVRRVSYVVQKFHELWSTNGLKSDRSFYPPSLYRFVPVHRTPSIRH